MNEARCILFVDLADSVSLFERLGDAAAAALVQRLLDRLRAEVAREGGRVVKSLGDGLLATFGPPEACLRAAERMVALAEPALAGVRVAIHRGPIVAGTDDVFGDAVNLAARIEARARPGEILASEAFVLALPPGLRERARPFDEVTVKGRSGPVRVWRLESEAPAATILGTGPEARPQGLLLRLRRGERVLELRRGERAVLGRDPSCDLVLSAPWCSRRHAILANLGDRCTLEDSSTNGTFLLPDGGELQLVRRETATFAGAGRMGLGLAPNEDLGQVVAFETGRG
ncbi:MAG: adenylate/guanylate cyclase domain-containing protein [Geminicoccaceae bacterium]|nr:adenylate/guanylate cyclase domain-containing protein [Geminicoccaceae bacterium]